MKIHLLFILLFTLNGLCFAQEEESAYQLNSEGMELYQQKKFRESIEKFEEASSLQFDYVYPHYNLACVLSLLANTDSDYGQGENYVNLQAHLLIALALSPEHRNKWKADPDLQWFRSTAEGRFLLKNTPTFFEAIENIYPSSAAGEKTFVHFTDTSQKTGEYFEGLSYYLLGYFTKADGGKWYIGTRNYYNTYEVACWQGDYITLKTDMLPEGFDFESQKGDYLGLYQQSENTAIYSSPNTDSALQEILPKDGHFAVIGIYTDPDDNKWYLSTYRGSFIWCRASDVGAGR